MLEVSFRPILWKTWWNHSSDSVPQAFPTPTQEPYSSPGASEPAVVPLYHSHNPWPSWSLVLIAPVDIKSGHTALNPLSSLRNETPASSAPNGSVFYLLSHSHAPTNSDPAEITWLHFFSCIYNPNSLAQPATPLSTTWKGEIKHESWRIYFLSKLLQFISFLQTYAPSQGVPPSSQPKHSNVFATRTAILRSQSEPRDPFCFGSYWRHHCHRLFVQRTSNMSEHVMNNQATENVASPVPIQPGASVNLNAGGTNAITTLPMGHNFQQR